MTEWLSIQSGLAYNSDSEDLHVDTVGRRASFYKLSSDHYTCTAQRTCIPMKLEFIL